MIGKLVNNMFYYSMKRHRQKSPKLIYIAMIINSELRIATIVLFNI